MQGDRKGDRVHGLNAMVIHKSSNKSISKPWLMLLAVVVALNFSTGFADDSANNSSTDSVDEDCATVEANGSCGADTDNGSTETGNQPANGLGNPVNVMTGNKFQQERDFSLPGSVLSFNRLYNSGSSDSNVGIGQGWSHSYAVRLYDAGNGIREIVQSNGSRLSFSPDGTNESGQPLMRGTTMNHGYIIQTDTNHEWHLPDGRNLVFKGSYLVRIDWPDRKQLVMFYRSGRLHSVTDELGRVLRFEYNPGVSRLFGYDTERFIDLAGHLSRVTLPDGSYIDYDYDQNRNLTRALFADGTSREYHYENSVYPNHLTGLTDRTGVRFATWNYDSEGRAISSEHANWAEKVTAVYPDPMAIARGDVVETVVTNSLGYESIYYWQQKPGQSQPLLLESTGAGCATCPPTGFRYTYDDKGRLLTSTDNSARIVRNQYDEQGRVVGVYETKPGQDEQLLIRQSYVDGTNLIQQMARRSINPAGEQVTQVTYDTTGLPIRINQTGYAPGNIDALDYIPISRTTLLQYENLLLSSIDGPRTDVDDITRFRYDNLGRLLRVELPSGESITIDEYDSMGRAISFRRADQPSVSLQFDDNGNISRVTRLGQTVEYIYSAENQLTSITNPNGKTTTLTYDDSQRLTRVSDDLGRTVELSFNSESQIQQRTFQGVNGELIRSLNYLFDAEGRIQSVSEQIQDHTSGNVFSKTFSLDYDENGKLNAATDVHTGATRNFVFNDLGRLLQTIDGNGLKVTQEYDVHNRLSAVTDRRLNTTKYHRDDFGQIRILVSPDTGITHYEYDAAGNRTQQRNANGEITTYRWDAANRLVEQRDNDGTAIYRYHPTNGQLIESSNAHTTETYTYTPLAQLRTHTREIDGHEFTTEYIYDVNGKLGNKILPDGQSLRYHYHESGANAGTLRAITKEALFGLSQSTLLGEIDLDWRDGETSFLSHNGHRTATQYHADGKVSSMSVADTLRLVYEYDEHGKIVGISQDGNAQRYGYSSGMLSEASTIFGNYEYRYDVSGNRTTVSAQSTTEQYDSNLNYSAVATGNRLESRTDEQSGEQIVYRYNSAGSPIGIGELTYTYNANQRPIEIKQKGKVIARYSYNNFGERIKKVTYSHNLKKVTYYLYDNRTMVAEIDGDTLEHRQTIYLKHAPVVHLIGNDVFAVHGDHLGTPKLLTNDEGQPVWEANHTPLGKAIISRQAIEFNLRFPGQYADAETGTHYNYLRDYDPRTGRYLTSDPVGLEGGNNTYAYADNNLLGAFDALGLTAQLASPSPTASQNQNNSNQFSSATANSPVANPSALTPDVTDLGMTDPNQLVLDYITFGSPCDSDAALEYFAEQIEKIVGGSYPSSLNMGNLLVGSEIDFVIENSDRYELYDIKLAQVQLETIAEFDDSSVLLIPECSSNEDVRDIVTGSLGSLVQPSEIDAVIASMDSADDGCNHASIIDVTDLHAEVLIRFQTKLATDPRIVSAEREVNLAQAELAAFLEQNPEHGCNLNDGYDLQRQVCSELLVLKADVERAAENYADALSDVYQEQVDNGMMPTHDTDAAADEVRKNVMLGLLGLFIPLTATDLAIEAATLGFGKIGKLFEGATDFFASISRANRADIDTYVANGSEAANRADQTNISVFNDYPTLQELAGNSYDEALRIEGLVGSGNLARFEQEIAKSSDLANAIKAKPDLIKQWSKLDDFPDARSDPNTLTMMHELAKDAPSQSKNSKAASRAAATLADGTTIRSKQTFGNINQGLLSPENMSSAGIEQVDEDTFKIKNVALYMDEVEKRYKERTGLDLETKMWDIIHDMVLKKPEQNFNMFDGPPGLHAEVLAVNNIFRQARELGHNTENIKINVSTLRPASRADQDFAACENCQDILLGELEDVTILTGIAERKEP